MGWKDKLQIASMAVLTLSVLGIIYIEAIKR